VFFVVVFSVHFNVMWVLYSPSQVHAGGIKFRPQRS